MDFFIFRRLLCFHTAHHSLAQNCRLYKGKREIIEKVNSCQIQLLVQGTVEYNGWLYCIFSVYLASLCSNSWLKSKMTVLGQCMCTVIVYLGYHTTRNQLDSRIATEINHLAVNFAIILNIILH